MQSKHSFTFLLQLFIIDYLASFGKNNWIVNHSALVVLHSYRPCHASQNILYIGILAQGSTHSNQDSHHSQNNQGGNHSHYRRSHNKIIIVIMMVSSSIPTQDACYSSHRKDTSMHHESGATRSRLHSRSRLSDVLAVIKVFVNYVYQLFNYMHMFLKCRSALPCQVAIENPNLDKYDGGQHMTGELQI